MPFRTSLPSFSPKTKKSSTEWLRRQSQDPFVKQRALGVTPSTLGSLGYTKDGTNINTTSLSAFRSRSAFKLIEMHEKYDQFLTKPDVRVVVDLGAAPGGWSQVVSQLVNGSQVKTEIEEAVDEVQLEREKSDQGDEELEGTEIDLDIFEDPRLKRKKKRPIQRKSITKPLASEPLDFYDPVNIDEDLERLSLGSSSGFTSKVKVVAVDRLGMDAMPGVHILKADFLHPRTEDMIRALIEDPPSSSFSSSSSSPSSLSSSYSLKLGLSNPVPPKVDIVLSDIASNVTGVPASDSEANLQVAQAVFTFTKNYLRSAQEIGRARGGVLLLKHFAHPSIDNFRKTVLEPHFCDVIYAKPKASRQESREGYFLCRGYYPPVF